MALTHLVSFGSTSVDSATSGSFTPTANARLLVAAFIDNPGTPNISSSAALDWAEVAKRNWSGANLYLRVWEAPAPASPSAMTVTITATGADAIAGMVVELDEADYDFSNWAYDDGNGAADVTLPSAPSEQVIGFCGLKTGTRTITPPSGFTESTEYSNGEVNLSVAYDETPSGAGPHSWGTSGSGGTSNIIAIMFEAIAGVTLYASGFANASAFGAANLKRTIKPVGIAAANGFGAPHVKRSITSPSIASGIAFGFPTLTGAIPTLVGQGIANANGFGAPSLSREIEPSSIASALAFGTPSLIKDYVYPPSIASALAFGAPNVANTAKPPSIVNANAFGSPFVGLKVGPPGIASGVSFGGVNVFIGAYASPAAERRHKADEQPRIARRVPV